MTTSPACQHCGASMKLYRADARYCSGACRVAAHRAKKAASTPEFPAQMLEAPRWVRAGANKAPLRVDTGRYASSTGPSTWSTYEAAAGSQYGVGLGWVLGNGVGCLDLDHCLDDDGQLENWAQELVDAHRAEALLIEVSRSGHGLHIFLPMEPGRGTKERGARRVETYPPDSGRYIAVTGNRFVG